MTAALYISHSSHCAPCSHLPPRIAALFSPHTPGQASSWSFPVFFSQFLLNSQNPWLLLTSVVTSTLLGTGSWQPLLVCHFG